MAFLNIPFGSLFALMMLLGRKGTQVQAAYTCPSGLTGQPFTTNVQGNTCYLCMNSGFMTCNTQGAWQGGTVVYTYTPEGCGEVICPDGPPPPPSDTCGAYVDISCTVGSVNCDAFVPETEADCRQTVKFKYEMRQTAPPQEAILTNVYITTDRPGSYWEEAQGKTRPILEDKWGTNLTPGNTVSNRLAHSEGDFINFCQDATYETKLDFTTDGGSLGRECVTSGTHTLTTTCASDASLCTANSNAPMSASASEPDVQITASSVEISSDDGNGTSRASGREIPAVLVSFVVACAAALA